MRANFHTHTKRCNHARGEDRAFVEAAIEAGLKVLGFSDHTPYVGFSGDYYSFYRMRPDQLSDYVYQIGRLREEYKNDIEIHIGLEAEYYPCLFEGLLEFLRPYGIEYLILGQHFTDDDQYGVYAADAVDADRAKKYADQCIEALKTGLFSYIAHPDLMGADRKSRIFHREMSRICGCAAELSLPVEVNVLGLYTGRAYPCEEYLRICRECDCTVILGTDAHEPIQFTDKRALERAQAMIREHSLRLTEEIDMTRLGKYYESNPR